MNEFKFQLKKIGDMIGNLFVIHPAQIDRWWIFFFSFCERSQHCLSGTENVPQKLLICSTLHLSAIFL